MSFHDDLRRQAWHLASRERRKPRQASLRRALSTAYYALFHLLIHDATTLVLGRQNAVRPFRHLLARTYSHQSMVATCKIFQGGTFPQNVVAVLGTPVVPPDLRDVAVAFVKLQEARHRADYNLGETFTRSGVKAQLTELDNAFEAWGRVRNNRMARFFLAVLPVWKELRG
jgi:hypothetical protein